MYMIINSLLLLMMFKLDIFISGSCYPPVNETGTYYRPVKAGYKLNDVVKYECSDANSHKFGDGNLTCLEYGIWSGMLSYCATPEVIKEVRHDSKDMKRTYDNKANTCEESGVAKPWLVSTHPSDMPIAVIKIVTKEPDTEEYRNRPVEIKVIVGSRNRCREQRDPPPKHHLFSKDRLVAHIFLCQSRSDHISINISGANWYRTTICEISIYRSPIHECDVRNMIIKNGYIKYSHQRPVLQYGELVSFLCNDGFVLKGDKYYAVCGQNLYIDELPKCEEKKTMTVLVTVVVVTSVCTVVIFILLFIACIAVFRKIREKKRKDRIKNEHIYSEPMYINNESEIEGMSPPIPPSFPPSFHKTDSKNKINTVDNNNKNELQENNHITEDAKIHLDCPIKNNEKIDEMRKNDLYSSD